MPTRVNKYGKLEKNIGVSLEVDLIKKFNKKLHEDRKTKKQFLVETIKNYLKEDK